MMPPVDPRDLDEICAGASDLWEHLRDQSLFLTGGTGFFGCWLLESFVEANRRLSLNATITVLTRSAASFRARCPHLAEDPSVTLLDGDVRSFLYPDGEFSLVIHAAAETGTPRTSEGRSASLTTLSTIFDGTRHTLDFAATHGTRKFLMVSSGAVYGTQPPNLTHVEEGYGGAPDPCLAGSAYGEAKRAAEALCVAYATGSELQCKIARCFAFVGPHLSLDGSYAIGNFIRNGLKSERIHIRGDGSPLRSYLYATDLVVWLWTMLIKAPSLRPINIGSAEAICIRELAATVRDVLMPTVGVEILQLPTPSVPASRYVPSVQRACKEFNLKQTVGLEEAIRRTAKWYGWKRDQGDAK